MSCHHTSHPWRPREGQSGPNKDFKGKIGTRRKFTRRAIKPLDFYSYQSGTVPEWMTTLAWPTSEEHLLHQRSCLLTQSLLSPSIVFPTPCHLQVTFSSHDDNGFKNATKIIGFNEQNCQWIGILYFTKFGKFDLYRSLQNSYNVKWANSKS